jgi:hypothetical protein
MIIFKKMLFKKQYITRKFELFEFLTRYRRHFSSFNNFCLSVVFCLNPLILKTNKSINGFS